MAFLATAVIILYGRPSREGRGLKSPCELGKSKGARVAPPARGVD